MNKKTKVKLRHSIHLTEFHLRCLEKRVSECNDALREALTGICVVGIEAPSEKALCAVHATLDAAQKLTETAFKVCTRMGVAVHVDVPSLGQHPPK